MTAKQTACEQTSAQHLFLGHYLYYCFCSTMGIVVGSFPVCMYVCMPVCRGRKCIMHIHKAIYISMTATQQNRLHVNKHQLSPYFWAIICITVSVQLWVVGSFPSSLFGEYIRRWWKILVAWVSEWCLSVCSFAYHLHNAYSYSSCISEYLIFGHYFFISKFLLTQIIFLTYLLF